MAVQGQRQHGGLDLDRLVAESAAQGLQHLRLEGEAVRPRAGRERAVPEFQLGAGVAVTQETLAQRAQEVRLDAHR